MSPRSAATKISAQSAINAQKITMATQDAFEVSSSATIEAAAAAEGQQRQAMAVATSSTTLKIMNSPNVIAVLVLLLFGLVTVNGLRCHMCGAYNEGVGSITPCLNYSEQYAHLYLKECSKKSEKFCVKYVSELSTVRDCATECSEKEIWETQTYCCDKDGCNGSSNLEASVGFLMLPLFCVICQLIKKLFQMRR